MSKEKDASFTAPDAVNEKPKATKSKAETAKQKPAKDQKPKDGVFKKISRYFKELKSEWKKIVWPTPKKVMNNTGVVLVFMGLAAVVIWSLTILFTQLFTLVF